MDERGGNQGVGDDPQVVQQVAPGATHYTTSRRQTAMSGRYCGFTVRSSASPHRLRVGDSNRSRISELALDNAVQVTPMPESTWLELGTDDVPSITTLQQARATIGLRRLGVLVPNGTFGVLTDLGVKLFQMHVQADHDPAFEVDGIRGPVTWGLLNHLLAIERGAQHRIGS